MTIFYLYAIFKIFFINSTNSFHPRIIDIIVETKVNIFDSVELSSNIIGTKGQSLYIINEFDALDVNGKTKTSHATYLYYWDENVNVTDKTGITEVTGSWVNANINFTSSIMIGDVQFDAVKLGKLLDDINPILCKISNGIPNITFIPHVKS